MSLKVKLEDIKSFNNVEFCFDKYIYQIRGDSGAGKTTLLEAINFCLSDKNGAQFSMKNRRPKITIEYERFRIEKIKNPEECILTDKNENKRIFVSDAAKETVKNILPCEFVRFGMSGNFLSLNSTERRNYIENEIQRFETFKNVDVNLAVKIKNAEKSLNSMRIEKAVLDKQIASNKYFSQDNNISIEQYDLLITKKMAEKQNYINGQISQEKAHIQQLEIDIHNLNKKQVNNELLETQESIMLLARDIASQPDLSKLRQLQTCLLKRKRFEQLEDKQPHPSIKCPKCEFEIVKFQQDKIKVGSKRTLDEEFEYQTLKTAQANASYKRIMIDQVNSKIFNIERMQNNLLSCISKLKNQAQPQCLCLDTIQKIKTQTKIISQQVQTKTIELNLTRDKLRQLQQQTVTTSLDIHDPLSLDILHLDKFDTQQLVQLKTTTQLWQQSQTLEQEIRKIDCLELAKLLILDKEWKQFRLDQTRQVQEKMEELINHYLSQLFTQDTIDFSFKDEDGKQLNLLFNYKARQIANINEFSGGERARITLAFCCATSIVRHVKVLMLDELLSTLDETNLINCLEFLDSFANTNKIYTLIVSHSSIANIIDNKIDL